MHTGITYSWFMDISRDRETWIKVGLFAKSQLILNMAWLSPDIVAGLMHNTKPCGLFDDGSVGCANPATVVVSHIKTWCLYSSVEK